MHRLILATRNKGKFEEISHDLKKPFPTLVCESLIGTSWPEVVEDQNTFVGNATKKAREIAQASQVVTLADDSGIEVDALFGAPGVFSARFAGPTADDRSNNEKLITSLVDIPLNKRTARYRCIMALYDPEREILKWTEGVVEGLIIDEPRGHGGFGYDPHFLLTDRNLTMAELPLDEKNRISHRGRALANMIPILKSLLS